MASRLCFCLFVSVTEPPCCASELPHELTTHSAVSLLQPTDMERTLSHYSGEVENIYENPEDVRQSPPQNAVYMDLKLTGETDVYRELDRTQVVITV
ncbi:hypothetical protein QTP70_019765 [Hemibagrus guttatus]|uniref:Uncharacterized protein n=1 Tax=Hemibagrus guttatus TaxID=175788 RepID=A0AAE0REZ3_9TELE|nr:hypothetical protein QTP70_019765 [Hemibagrus guttatus]